MRVYVCVRACERVRACVSVRVCVTVSVKVSVGVRQRAHVYLGVSEGVHVNSSEMHFARVYRGWGDCGKQGCQLILLK